jgi:hypothetical protein
MLPFSKRRTRGGQLREGRVSRRAEAHVLRLEWRQLAESMEDIEPGPASGMHYLAHDGLPFISLEQKSFLACDRETRQGCVSIAQNLVAEERQFSRHFRAALISVLTEPVETSS